MFSNIGGKIKVFVIVVTILNIIGCILFGGIMIAYSILGDKMLAVLAAVGLDRAVVDMTRGAKGAFGVTAGLVIMTAGSFACWIVSFIPYGLGQLIQNSDRMVKSMDYMKNTMASLVQQDTDNDAGVQYGMYPYPIYTDQYGRPVYPAPGYGYYPEEEANAQAYPGEEQPAEDASTRPEAESMTQNAPTQQDSVAQDAHVTPEQ